MAPVPPPFPKELTFAPIKHKTLFKLKVKHHKKPKFSKFGIPREAKYYVPEARDTTKPGLHFGDITLEPNYEASVHYVGDLVVITNFKDPKKLPTIPSLADILKNRWYHGLVPLDIYNNIITYTAMNNLVIDCKIVAFKLDSISIKGTPCIYFGIVPSTKPENFVQGKSVVASEVEIPRKLMVEYFITGLCGCSDNCYRVKVRLWTNNTLECCSNSVPWGSVWLISGELHDDPMNVLETRQCRVCAACFKCGFNGKYCRVHRTCKHKGRSVAIDNFGDLEKALVNSKDTTCIITTLLGE